MSSFLTSSVTSISPDLYSAPSYSAPVLEPVARIDARAAYQGQIAFDTRYIFIESEENSLQIWNKQTLTLERSFSLSGTHGIDLFSIIKVVDNRLWVYIANGLSAELQLLDLATDNLICKMSTNRFIASDHDCLIQSRYRWITELNQYENQAMIVNPVNGELLCSLDNCGYHSLGSHPKSLSCPPVFKGDNVMTGHNNGSVNVWNKFNGHFITNLAQIEEEEARSDVTHLIVSDDRIFWGDCHGVVRSSNVLEADDVLIYENPELLTSCCELEISDNLLMGKFSHHGKSYVTVWQKDSGSFLYSLEYNEGKILISGMRLIVYKNDKHVLEIFDKQEGALILSIADTPLRCWNFKVFENLLIIPCVDGHHLQIRNLEDGALLHTISANVSNFSLDGSRLITYDAEEIADVLIYDLSVLLPS